jgi:glyoxylase-like metal-dependent hydrolase (beta-lactamase superfamily II)
LAALGAFAWWAALDGGAPARADNVFDLGAYRALVAADSAETLPTQVRVEFGGEGAAPSFATQAGDFSGEVTLAYTAFQIVGPQGWSIVDAAMDEETTTAGGQGKGRFDAPAYERLLAALVSAEHVLVTHEHPDHVMGIARHPDPEALAPRLRLTQIQRDGMRPHARDGALAPAIANAAPLELAGPRRIAPGLVAIPAAGHSPGSTVFYLRTPAREYLLIGDIAWRMSNIAELRARPRFIRWVVPGVDPDRPAVLRQLRALHDLSRAEPDLVIVPAHDIGRLNDLIAAGALHRGFLTAELPANPAPP